MFLATLVFTGDERGVPRWSVGVGKKLDMEIFWPKKYFFTRCFWRRWGIDIRVWHRLRSLDVKFESNPSHKKSWRLVKKDKSENQLDDGGRSFFISSPVVWIQINGLGSFSTKIWPGWKLFRLTMGHWYSCLASLERPGYKIWVKSESSKKVDFWWKKTSPKINWTTGEEILLV